MTASTNLGDNNSHCVIINAAGSASVVWDHKAQLPPQSPWFKTKPPNLKNHLSLLRWDSRVTDRVGRDAEFDDLLAWTDGGGPGVEARLITGDGGTGKSRLGGDLAQELVKRGWRAEKLAERLTEEVMLPLGDFRPAEPKATLADQLQNRQPINKPAHKGGLLIVVDYPEGRMPLVERLLESLRDYVGEDNLRIRLLLLSRRDSDEWEPPIGRARAEGLFQADPIRLGRSVDPRAQFITILNGLASTLKVAAPALPAGEPDRWLAGNRPYQQPLFMAAVALHFCLHPESGLALGGPEAVKALVERERRRAERESIALGWDQNILPRLLALATLRGGLEAAKLNELGQMLGAPAGQDLCDRLRDGGDGRIKDNILPALEPDLPGAAFATLVLSERAGIAPDWIWQTIADNPMGLIPRLEQVCHDAEGTLQLLTNQPNQRISRLLATMVDGRMDRARGLKMLAYSEDHRTHRFATLAAMVVKNLLDDPALDEADRATLLNNLSEYLSDAGDGPGALDAIRKAVAIHQTLAKENPARFNPDWAGSLNNLSNRLSNAGDGPGALDASKKSVEIRETLAKENPARFNPDLAGSLNNLSNRLSDAGDRPGALDAIKKAVAIYQTLAKQNPARFNPDLAGSLNNLSNRLSDAGDVPGALDAIKKVVAIRETLAKENPARFNPDWAASLNNLSNRLSDAGDGPGALEAIKKAVAIGETLAQENPARFNPVLADSLNNLSNCLSGAGDGPGALDAIKKAVAIRETLAKENPARFNPDWAMSLNNLSLRLSEAGDGPRALDAIKKAVAIRETLAQENPARFNADWADSLNNLSIRLSDAGDGPGALDAIKKAVAIREILAKENPARFNPDLAGSLAILAMKTFDGGDRGEAIRLMERAITLITPQAEAYPNSEAGKWLTRMQTLLAHFRATPP